MVKVICPEFTFCSKMTFWGLEKNEEGVGTFYLRRSRKVYESRFLSFLNYFEFLTYVKIVTTCDKVDHMWNVWPHVTSVTTCDKCDHMWPLWQVCPHVTIMNTRDKCDHIMVIETSWTFGHHGHLDNTDICLLANPSTLHLGDKCRGTGCVYSAPASRPKTRRGIYAVPA